MYFRFSISYSRLIAPSHCQKMMNSLCNSLRVCYGTMSKRDVRQHELARAEMERERKEGQALLKSMAMGSKDSIDWHAIIAKANELHQREQEWLRQEDSQERRRFVQRQHRALQKRRKYDSIGNFSINLLTYRTEKEDSKATKSVNSSTGSTNEDQEEEVSSLESRGAPMYRPQYLELCHAASSNSTDVAVAESKLYSVDSGSFCPSSQSSGMEVIEDQLHSHDSDSI